MSLISVTLAAIPVNSVRKPTTHGTSMCLAQQYWKWHLVLTPMAQPLMLPLPQHPLGEVTALPFMPRAVVAFPLSPDDDTLCADSRGMQGTADYERHCVLPL